MKKFDISQIDRIIQMCWEDRTPFDAIKIQFNISENDIISIMRNNLKERSFLNWRKRIDNRKTKHNSLSISGKKRFKSKSQRQISFNRHK